MTLSAAAAWQAVRGHVFAPAPSAVVEAYALGVSGPWAVTTAVTLACGGLWTVAMLVREVARVRARRRRRRIELLVRAPLLPGDTTGNDGLTILEGERSDAWWLPGAAPRLVITTAALRRLKGRGNWTPYSPTSRGTHRPDTTGCCTARVHRLVELAADDTASRRFGWLPTALALVELNEDRGVFSPSPIDRAQVPQRVHRLPAPPGRLTADRRLRLTAACHAGAGGTGTGGVQPRLRALG